MEALYNKLGQRLKGFIRRRVLDDTVAEDILHEAFLKMHNNIDNLRDEGKIESWLYQITRNAIADHFRGRRPTTKLHDDLHVVDGDDDNDAMKRISLSVKGMVQQLPAPYRESIILTEYRGLTQKELAQHQGISISGAKSRVQRARKMLKDMLMNCCHFEFDRYGTIIDYHPISCCCCSQQKKGE